MAARARTTGACVGPKLKLGPRLGDPYPTRSRPGTGECRACGDDEPATGIGHSAVAREARTARTTAGRQSPRHQRPASPMGWIDHPHSAPSAPRQPGSGLRAALTAWRFEEPFQRRGRAARTCAARGGGAPRGRPGARVRSRSVSQDPAGLIQLVRLGGLTHAGHGWRSAGRRERPQRRLPLPAQPGGAARPAGAGSPARRQAGPHSVAGVREVSTVAASVVARPITHADARRVSLPKAKAKNDSASQRI